MANWFPTSSIPAPSVYMDFAGNYYIGGTLTGLLSCTRASTAYARTQAGTLLSFGNDTLRRTDLGLLVEEARTNLVIQSQTFDSASWTKSQVTITADTDTAPDGTLTADRLTPNTGNNTKGLFRNYTGTVASYTNTIYVKANGGRWIGLGFGGGTTVDGAFFDLTNGVAGTVAAGTTATIQVLSNGWYRLGVTKTLTAATWYNQVEPHSADNESSTWNSAAGAEKFYVWGAQGELGAFLTTYIPTTTVSVTRAADIVTSSGALSSVFSSGVGSVVSYTTSWNNIVAARIVQDVTNTHAILGYNSTPVGATTWTSAGTTLLTATNAPLRTATAKLGVSGDSTGRSLVSNGGTVATDANAAQALSSLQIGSTAAAGNFLDGYISRLVFWNTKLSDTTLQALTA